MDNEPTATKDEGFLSRMALNDNKAGMEGLDRDKINSIIMESSKVSSHEMYTPNVNNIVIKICETLYCEVIY